MVFPEEETMPFDLGFVPGDAPRKRFAIVEKSEPTIASLIESGSRLYAGGTIYYSDIFDETNRITFCIWWGPDDLTAEGATYCKKQNDYGPPDRPVAVSPDCTLGSAE